ncbi:hypothetical protein NLM27_41935 [Bradyrhizobium sp. CCGB12]|uniref:hypothetical protein n=1 Tax=Bradyrhizobium sp. CCGB12 TaxID=2949632 RepID=UPI0020B39F97|nr:hypothetical protein [Bradyrhizobium sp. CCGB12]MCP3395296.1 hypothetical protein [Bradyrhizobium sp. CCGB12]
MAVIFYSPVGPIAITPLQQYGVDGKLVPYGSGSDRSETYEYILEDPSQWPTINKLELKVFYSPKWRLVEIINKAGDIIRDVKGAIENLCAVIPEVCAAVVASPGPATQAAERRSPIPVGSEARTPLPPTPPSEPGQPGQLTVRTFSSAQAVAPLRIPSPGRDQRALVEPRRTEIYEGLPPHLRARVERQEQSVLPPGAGKQARAVLEILKEWSPGTLLNVCFVSGTRDLRTRIAEAASEWAKFGNIRFNFGNPLSPQLCPSGLQAVVAGSEPDTKQSDAESKAGSEQRSDPRSMLFHIRIGFEYRGYWSLVGQDSVNLADQYEQSMNLEGYDIVPPNEPKFSQVVLHEFGHALGFHHEHQNTQAPCENEFKWDEIYASLAQPPNSWSKETVDFNMRRLVNDGRYTSAVFDPHSIMLYHFPDWMYVGGARSLCYITSENMTLSDGDKAALKEAYPFENVAAVFRKRENLAEQLKVAVRAIPSASYKERGLAQIDVIAKSDLPVSARRDQRQRLMAPVE